MRKLLLLLISTIFISCQTSSSKNLWTIIEPLPLNNDIEKLEIIVDTLRSQAKNKFDMKVEIGTVKKTISKKKN